MMVLVDTSVWIDHLRRSEPGLRELLEQRQVLVHPFVVGELAMGNLKQRDVLLDWLQNLPQVMVAEEDEVLRFISDHGLAGSGIGYVDAHLLAAARLTPGTLLWTRDGRLSEVAERLSLTSGGMG